MSTRRDGKHPARDADALATPSPSGAEIPPVVVQAAETDDPETADRVVSAIVAFLDSDQDGAP